MPILKIEILNSLIEINFEEKEREKLLLLIKNFKNRFNEFHNDDNQKIKDNTIIFLAALKAEDELEEIKNLVKKNNQDKNKISEQKKIIGGLSREIVLLRDKVNESNSHCLSKDKSNLLAMEEISKLEVMLKLIQKKILSNNDN